MYKYLLYYVHLIKFSLDCTDIMLEGWLQKFLVRQPFTSPSGNDDAVSSGSVQSEVSPSTSKAVTTFREGSE